jgi:polyketide biosynthesis acyl carrier protein
MDKKTVFDVLVQHARSVIPAFAGHAFVYDDSLRDLGANSVDRTEIIMMTLESLSLDMSLVELARAECMGDLAEIMQQRLALV